MSNVNQQLNRQLFENEEDDFGGRYEYETSGHINTKNYGNSCCDFFTYE